MEHELIDVNLLVHSQISNLALIRVAN